MNTSGLTTKKINHRLPRLKLIRLEREKVKQVRMKSKAADVYIFTPETDLEVAAIALATEGEIGWKGSLYSLEYFDCHLEHTCFIFATEPKETSIQQWLLVNFDTRADAKYWIVLGNKLLSEVYYAWAKIVKAPHPYFDLQKMKIIQYQDRSSSCDLF
jgi:hypothetical protein